MADTNITTRVVMAADSTSLTAAMQKAEAQFAQFNKMVDSTQSVVGKFSGIMGSIAAILAGGKMFSAAIEETKKWTLEAVQLSKQLGITTQEASALNLGADDVGVSFETLTGAATALTRQSIRNAEAFQHYGIALKDSNGHQRSTMEIMEDVIEKMKNTKEGRDRELMGMQLLGRGWAEYRSILKLATLDMDEARQKAKELHLEVSPEQAAQVREYKLAMNDVHDVFVALQNQLGTKLLPHLTQAAVWFAEIGPTAVEIFSGAIKGLTTFAQYAALGFTLMYETVKAGLSQIITAVTTVWSVIQKVMAGDFRGAVETARVGWSEMGKAGDEWADRVIKAVDRTNDAMLKSWGFRSSKSGKKLPDEGDDNRVTPFDKEGAGLMKQWQEELIKIRREMELAKAPVSELSRQFLEADQAVALLLNKFKSIPGAAGILAEFGQAKKDVIMQKVYQEMAINDADPTKNEAWLNAVGKLSEAQQKLFDESAMRNDWKARWNAARALELQAEEEFLVMHKVGLDREYDETLLQIGREEEALINAWRDKLGGEEEFQKKKYEIQNFYDQQRVNAGIVNEMKLAQTRNTINQNYLEAFSSFASAINGIAGGKNKVLYALTQAAAIATTFLSTQAASAAALAPPPLGLGPIAGAPLAASIELKGYVSMAAMAATTLANVMSSGGSTGSLDYSGGSSSVVTQPVNTTSQQPGNLTIHIQTAIGERKWFEDNLPAILKDFNSRNIPAGVVYTTTPN